MINDDEGWYKTDYVSGNPAKELLDFLLLNGILFKLKIDVLPYDPSPISMPYNVTWESVTISDSSYLGGGNQNTSAVNRRLPSFGDALYASEVFQNEFYPPGQIMAAVWVAPVGSTRVDALVTDPMGRRVGTIVSGQTNYSVNEIPEAIYLPPIVYNDSYTIGIAIIPNPLDGDYTATVYGNEPADFQLQTVRLDNSSLIEKLTIEDNIAQGDVKNYSFAAIANFTSNVTSGPSPLPVAFKDMSVNQATAWYWEFGDGQSSNEQNPVHIYEGAGNYTVNLTATNDGGTNTRSNIDYVTVYSPTSVPVPVANFTANVTSGQIPLAVSFTDSSSNLPDRWYWDFGDGTNSTIQNPTHVYTAAGNYTVSLNVSNANGSDVRSYSDYITAMRPVQNHDIVVILKDSEGNGLVGGDVSYYANGWKAFGTTDSNGTAAMDLLPGTYTFRMNYAGASENLQQDLNVNPTVTFQTRNVSVYLVDSNGEALDPGLVKYYANGWKSFGVTSNGTVAKELLPGQFTLSMTYAGGSTSKSQDVSVNPSITFQTGQVVSLSGNCTHYYADGWRAFTQGIELIPGHYEFRYTNGLPGAGYDIFSGAVNTIQ
jgi:PKD repeat protein